MQQSRVYRKRNKLHKYEVQWCIDFLKVFGYRVLVITPSVSCNFLKCFFVAAIDCLGNKCLLSVCRFNKIWRVYDLAYLTEDIVPTGLNKDIVNYLQAYNQHFIKFVNKDHVLILPHILYIDYFKPYNVNLLNTHDDAFDIPEPLKQFRSVTTT